MTTRLPRTPEAPLPALAELLAPFAVHFVPRPSATSLERYVTGLPTEHPTSEQRLQYLLTDLAGDHDT